MGVSRDIIFQLAQVYMTLSAHLMHNCTSLCYNRILSTTSIGFMHENWQSRAFTETGFDSIILTLIQFMEVNDNSS